MEPVHLCIRLFAIETPLINIYPINNFN